MENLNSFPDPYLELFTTEGKRLLPLIGKNFWKVGRGKENDLVIADPCISRNHAILQLTETGEFILIDLGSRNGTFVNDRPVNNLPVVLQHSAIIFFGKTKVEFHCPGSLNTSNGGKDTNPINMTASALHERRLTSVLVVDMRNFTVLTRQVKDSLLSALIGSWFQQSGNIIRQSGSWVDKYIGDAVMAVWFHEQQSVTSADILKILRCVDQLRAMTAALSQEYPLPFELRIGVGINTGYAMVGNTGSRNHPDYTAIGDTVNAAFRLETSTKEMGIDIAIGETTYHYLSPPQNQVFKPYRVNLKGYETPMTTYGMTFADLIQFLAISELEPLV